MQNSTRHFTTPLLFSVSSQVATEAQGNPWSIETSSARNHIPYVASSSLRVSSNSIHTSSSSPSFGSTHGGGGTTQVAAGGAYQAAGTDDFDLQYGISK